MRILALKARGFVLPHIHRCMVRAFRDLGAEVVEVALDPCPSPWENLREILRQGRFHAVFTLDLGGDPSFASQVGAHQWELGTVWATWFVDDPEGYGFPTSCDPHWTLALCWDRRLCQDQFRQGGVQVHHLPLAADPLRFRPALPPAPELPAQGVFVGALAHPNELLQRVAASTPGVREAVESVWERYRADMVQSLHGLVWEALSVFLGRPVSELRADSLCRLWVQACVFAVGIRKRVELVRWALGAGGAVFGEPQWGLHIGPRLYRGPLAYGEEDLPRQYRKSAFVLEIRQPQSRTGLTQRLFDGSCCGTAVVAEWSPELGEILDDEEDVYSFRDLPGAREARERCLADPREAARKASRARRTVLGRHTYRHRAARILSLLEERIFG
jgi:glycosyltransferase involved in cell wall biosynthesis